MASDAIPAGTWVVIPAHNEAGMIANVIADAQRWMPAVIVVDDCSNDATAETARRSGAKVLRHLLNRGQGAAIQTGIDYALAHDARFVVTMDADGQHTADDFPALLRPLIAGEADIVLGSRFLEASNSVPALRRLLLRMAVLFTRLTSGVRVTDTHNGLRAFTGAAAARLHITLDRMAHASELFDQIRTSALRYKEVPVHVRYTEYSRLKGQRSTHAVRVAFDYFIGRWMR